MERLVLHEDVAKLAIGRQRVDRGLAGRGRSESVVAQVEADAQARGVPLPCREGDAIRREKPEMVGAEGRLDRAAFLIGELVAPGVRVGELGRPWSRRRVEGTKNLENLFGSVRVVPVEDMGRREREKEVGSQNLDGAVRPILILGKGDSQLSRQSENVLLAQSDAAPHGPSPAAGGQADLNGPRVLGVHLDIHDSVADFAGDDGHRSKQAERPQVPLGFRKDGGIVDVALFEDEEAANRRVERDDVERVGAPIEEALDLVGGEYVDRFDGDLADEHRLARIDGARQQSQ